MNWTAVKAIYLNTLNKEFRSKSIYFLFALTILVILSIQGGFNFLKSGTIDVSGMLLNSETKMTIFFLVISIWNVLLAAILGTDCVRSDLNNGIINQLLSLPVRRIEYLSARILGTWTIIIAYYLVSILTGSLLFSIFSKAFVFNFDIFPALIASSLSMLAVVTFGLFFSQYMPKLISLFVTIFFSIFISVANNKLGDLNLSDVFSDLGFIRVFQIIAHYLFPRTGSLNTFGISLVQGEMPDQNLIIEYGHFILSYALVFWLINLLFKRRDF